MRGLMRRLAGFLGRRRRWVLTLWIVAVALALPFASRQTEHLTGGGFDVPGSQSKAVSEALQNDFGSQSNGISVLLKAGPHAGSAAIAAAPRRVRREVATLDGVTLPAAVARRAELRLRRGDVALMPLS